MELGRSGAVEQRSRLRRGVAAPARHGARTDVDHVRVRPIAAGVRAQSLTPVRVERSPTVLFRSDDGGTNWQQLSIGSIDTGGTGVMRLLAVSPTDPDVVFLRAERPGKSAVYRSGDAGATFIEVVSLPETVRAFAIRRDGATVIAGTVYSGVRISSDGGMTWTEPTEQPQMACVGERGDGTLFACGANGAPDFFMVGRSTDGMTWNRVARLADIDAPVDCPAGTVQHDTCEQIQWEPLCRIGLPPCAPPPAVDAGVTEPARDCEGGCCSSQGSVAALFLLPLLWCFPRRSRPSIEMAAEVVFQLVGEARLHRTAKRARRAWRLERDSATHARALFAQRQDLAEHVEYARDAQRDAGADRVFVDVGAGHVLSAEAP